MRRRESKGSGKDPVMSGVCAFQIGPGEWHAGVEGTLGVGGPRLDVLQVSLGQGGRWARELALPRPWCDLGLPGWDGRRALMLQGLRCRAVCKGTSWFGTEWRYGGEILH